MSRVLVVDDDPQLRAALGREIAQHGYEVESAASVDEALSILGRLEIDVLLTDLRMGERDGIDLLTTARATSERTRSILMSAFATARDYQAATDLGAVRVLSKPFTPAEAIEAIEQAIDCEKGFRGSIHGLSLVDMLQMFHFGLRSISINVGGVVPGTIHLDRGEIVHAQRGGLSGEEALRAVLASQSGSVSTSVLGSVPQTVFRSFQSLLVDLVRQLDEAERGASPPHADSSPPARPSLFPFFASSMLPPPSVPEPEPSSLLPSATASEAAIRLTSLNVAADLCVLDLPVGRPTNVRGTLGDPDLVLEVRELVRSLSEMIPGVRKVECVGAEIGVGVVVTAERDAAVVVAGDLSGRHAAVRFRGELERVGQVVGLIEKMGESNGKDR